MKLKSYKDLSVENVALTGVVILLVILGYGAYKYNSLTKTYDAAKAENLDLSIQLEGARGQIDDLSQLAEYQQTVIATFQGQIENIGSTVSTLDKLAKTDKELLRKYSKVYFLSENYVPAELAKVDNEYTLSTDGNFLIHAQVWPYLKKLLDAARRDGINIIIASAFRSFDTQASLKSGYTVVYGSGANQFSADQGYSEHQLGAAVDFTTEKVGGGLSGFEKDPAYKWLLDNAYLYGFVLSYPEDNSYYKFEPWHWRFVGVKLATFLHDEGKHFYDLDQREIDAYLVNLFD